MSTDTALPTFRAGGGAATNAAAFTAAFSAMSLDTPGFFAAGSASASGGASSTGVGIDGAHMPPRGPRAAAVPGKRLFQTPSSAGGSMLDSPTGFTPSPVPFGGVGFTPSPLAGSNVGTGGSNGDSAAADAAAAAAGRAGLEKVPFPGFGAAAGGDASSSPDGFSFNLGE
jgi:hypothetical protein